MASRTDFYFRQKVTEAELDLAFELLEKADRDLAADIGIYGIISGAEPTSHAKGMLHLRSYLKAGHWDHLTRRALQAAIMSRTVVLSQSRLAEVSR